MGDVGSYIMMALLGAGAVYGLANKGKPRPALSNAKKKLVIGLFGVVIVCGALLLLVPSLAPPPR